MHILLIHQIFTGGDDPGGTRHFELGNRLIDLGHRLTVIASPANYLTRRRVVEKEGREHVAGPSSGIDVKNAWTYTPLKGNFLGRVLSFVSFAISSPFKAAGVRPTDVVWGTSPPMFQALSAYVVSRLKRVPLVLEIRDLWPEFAVQTGVLRNRYLIALSRRLEAFLYRAADRIIVNSPGFVPYITARGVSEAKIELVPNGTAVEQFEGHDGGRVVKELGLDGKFIAMYTGAHGLANDLETVLDAAHLSRDHDDIQYVLVGDGREKESLMKEAERRGLANVLFVPPQPKSEMPSYLAAADVCIATLKPAPSLDTTYPNKVFDYMAAGRPVVLAIDGAIREVVDKAGCGEFVEPGDGEAMSNSVIGYSLNPGAVKKQGVSGHSYVKKHFDWPIHTASLEGVFLEAIRNRPKMGIIGRTVKRMLDIVVSSISLLLLLLPFIVIALAIKIESRGGVFFRQERVGRNGRIIRPWKFRTMIEGAQFTGLGNRVAEDDSRITRVGRLLRNTGVDELPQVIDVMIGQMSLVGPRPTLPHQVALYDDFQRRRMAVRPGITGSAVIRGRNAISWDDRIKFDVEYIDQWSIWTDLKILFLTPWKVLVTREGVYGLDGVNEDFGAVDSESSSE